ncbi:baseplate J/gp47 family protein [Kitasatospora purpeofusca]|uniref:baseplate J/gp47 family protein n=1 Tax=Kitasatospora purpeofusca TaxID=67352 RepID=UPI00369CA9AE
MGVTDAGPVAQIDYTSRDFIGFRDSLLDYASQRIPEWTSRSPSDFGVMLVEAFAYMGDVMSFYQDRIQDEAFLGTATLRSSVVAIAQQLGYHPYHAVPARGQVTFVAVPGLAEDHVLPAGTQLITRFSTALDAPIVFETDTDVTVPAFGTLDPPVAQVGITEGTTQGTRSLTLYPTDTHPTTVTVDTEATIGTTTSPVLRVEDIGTSTGGRSQTWTLALAPVLESTVRILLDDGTGGSEWTRAEDFLLAGPTDRIFTLVTDDQGVTHIEVGDGVNGAVPQTGLRICAAYRTGGGAFANLPAGSLVDFADPVPGIAIGSSSATTGGFDPEPIDQIRANAPRVFRTQGRAISLQDYADLALRVPGVADARAVGSSATSVMVYIVGASNSPAPQALCDQVTAVLRPAGASGVTVQVVTGQLVAVNLGAAVGDPVTVQVQPTYRRDAVLLSVQQAVQQLFTPEATSFGSRVSLSQVYRAIQDTPGVAYVRIPMMARADLPQSGTADAVFRDWEIPVLGQLTVTATGGV